MTPTVTISRELAALAVSIVSRASREFGDCKSATHSTMRCAAELRAALDDPQGITDSDSEGEIIRPGDSIYFSYGISPAPPMPPPPTDEPGTMLIRFERSPRGLWHPSCTESRNAIVREVEITTAYGLVECTACGRRAKLPVGSGVETRCEEIPQPNVES